MNPRTTLQERYPSADFSIYFRHLESCRTEKGLNTHEHHICPRKQFPEYMTAPENLITLTVEDHAWAHRLLEAACGIKAPASALLEAQLVGAAKGGRVAGNINKENRIGYCGLTLEQRQTAGRKGGPASAAVQKKNGTGFYGMTLEQRRAASARGGHSPIPLHVRWHVARHVVNPMCQLCAAEGVS